MPDLKIGKDFSGHVGQGLPFKMSLLDRLLIRLGDRRLSHQLARAETLASRVRELEKARDDDDDNRFLLERLSDLAVNLMDAEKKNDILQEENETLSKRLREAETKLRRYELGAVH